MKKYDLIVVGGGAAGFFTAINAVILNSSLSVLILERGKDVLQKVKISGGGRCNVTHAEFIPKELSKNYPRGERELQGPFHTFMTGDVMEWFENRGVALKIEKDGRVFPNSNSSQTIIDCFLAEAQKRNITIKTQQLVVDFIPQELGGWQVLTKKGQYESKKIVIATGSQSKIWQKLSNLGLEVVSAVPSLFTFNAEDKIITKLSGVAVNTTVSIPQLKLKNEGPLLITHWGFSGPAVLKLSAWGARILEECNYKFEFVVNWLKTESFEDCRFGLQDVKRDNSKQLVIKYPLYQLPKRLWRHLISVAGITDTQRWADINKKQLTALANQLTRATYKIDGKSVFKEEFVTAGGVNLKEINFKTYECAKLPNCYLVGEVLNIDAITGGFNFQNAWTGGFIAAQAIAR